MYTVYSAMTLYVILILAIFVGARVFPLLREFLEETEGYRLPLTILGALVCYHVGHTVAKGLTAYLPRVESVEVIALARLEVSNVSSSTYVALDRDGFGNSQYSFRTKRAGLPSRIESLYLNKSVTLVEGVEDDNASLVVSCTAPDINANFVEWTIITLDDRNCNLEIRVPRGSLSLLSS